MATNTVMHQQQAEKKRAACRLTLNLFPPYGTVCFHRESEARTRFRIVLSDLIKSTGENTSQDAFKHRLVDPGAAAHPKRKAQIIKNLTLIDFLNFS